MTHPADHGSARLPLPAHSSSPSSHQAESAPSDPFGVAGSAPGTFIVCDPRMVPGETPGQPIWASEEHVGRRRPGCEVESAQAPRPTPGTDSREAPSLMAGAGSRIHSNYHHRREP